MKLSAVGHYAVASWLVAGTLLAWSIEPIRDGAKDAAIGMLAIATTVAMSGLAVAAWDRFLRDKP